MSKTPDNDKPDTENDDSQEREKSKQSEKEDKKDLKRLTCLNRLSILPQDKKPRHRGPPEKTEEEVRELEKSFVLDGIALSAISIDYGKVNPKLGPAIPPYNAQKDKSCDQYFKYRGVDKVLENTEQTEGGTSTAGPYVDKFNDSGSGFRYLSKRNQHGIGHSKDQIDGHGQFMTNLKDVHSYSGEFGYRRNVPHLRQNPSSFGVYGRSPMW